MDEIKKKNDPNKLLEAYKMAQEMDESFQDDYTDEEVDRMLDVLMWSESSGGKNFDHRLMESGPHKGHRAIGRWGLMPNTVKEFTNRARTAGTVTPEMEAAAKMDAATMKAHLEKNPELERRYAEQLARHVINKHPGNEEAQAYSWKYGHNMGTDKILNKKNWQDDEYIEKYRRFRNKLFGY